MDAIMTSLPLAADAPHPDRMQVDAVGGAVPQAPHATSSGAGPSTEDTPMGEQAQPKAARNASEAPLLKLSVNLIDTYKMINQVYYEKRKRRQEEKTSSANQAGQSTKQRKGSFFNHGWDDENYDYVVKNGELFNDRYTVSTVIGKGSFGQVVKALDNTTQEWVAIKIIKSRVALLGRCAVAMALLVRSLSSSTAALMSPARRLG